MGPEASAMTFRPVALIVIAVHAVHGLHSAGAGEPHGPEPEMEVASATDQLPGYPITATTPAGRSMVFPGDPPVVVILPTCASG